MLRILTTSNGKQMITSTSTAKDKTVEKILAEVGIREAVSLFNMQLVPARCPGPRSVNHLPILPL